MFEIARYEYENRWFIIEKKLINLCHSNNQDTYWEKKMIKSKPIPLGFAPSSNLYKHMTVLFPQILAVANLHNSSASMHKIKYKNKFFLTSPLGK